MWGEPLLARALRKVSGKVASAGMKQFAAAIRARGGQPLRIVMPDGAHFDFDAAPRVTLTIRDPAALGRLSAPTLGNLAEAFVDGQIDLDGDIEVACATISALVEAAGTPASKRPALAPAPHRPQSDRTDIRHHYDVGNDFYRLWLDARMVYSCAYFETGAEDIDTAQRAKLDHVCRKLRLTPGERLLDIGCGWGALVLHAAQHYGVTAVGITLSTQQAALAQERVAQAGLQDQIEILLLDYRDLPARFGERAFDKVASIGMFEHVGVNNLARYFGIAARLLRDRGLMLNHGITSSDTANRPVGSDAGEFVGKYVFPNGELPHLHVAVREMSVAGFEVFDVESLRPHYALTLAQWSSRLENQLREAAALVSDRTLRIWRVYLAGCGYGFAQGWMNLYQVLGSRQTGPGATALPLTRAWMYR